MTIREPDPQPQNRDELVDHGLAEAVDGGHGAATRLFGRTRESAALADALARVTSTERSELVLLSGGPGVGKSALVNRLDTLAQSTPHHFAVGKCEQLRDGISFAPLIQAIQSLTHDLLGKSDSTLREMRARLQSELGLDARLLVGLVPGMEVVLGNQPSRLEMPPALAKLRVQRALLTTIAAFATADRPLILFMDDLQWSDPSSLEVLIAMAADAPAHILTVVAYRNEEATDMLRVQPFLAALRASAMPLTEISVHPLALGPLMELLAAHLEDAQTDPALLASVMLDETGGNPFFVHQMVQTIQETGIAGVEEDRRRRVQTAPWRPAGTQADNVVDFMSNRIDRLPDEQIQFLKHLALIGNGAHFETLAASIGSDADSLLLVAESLRESGFVRRELGNWAFTHDRIGEVSHALTTGTERPQQHARLARLILTMTDHAPNGPALSVAEHIERAMLGQISDDDRPAFAQALLGAAAQSQKETATGRAARYIEGASLLASQEWWTSHYMLAFSIEFARCQALLQQGAAGTAAKEIEQLVERAQGDIDRSAACRLKATCCTLQSDYDGAIEAALTGLELLGVTLHRFPTKEECDCAYARVRRLLEDRTVGSLSDLPLSTDVEVEAIISLLSTLISAIFSDDGLRFVHLAKIVELTLVHGVTSGSAYGLAWFGVFVADLYGDYLEGFDFSQAALELVDRHGFETQRTGTLVAFDQISPWTRDFPFAVARIREAIAAGHAANDLGMTCYARNHLITDLIQMGAPIADIAEEARRGLELTRAIGFRDIELLIAGQKAFVERLATDEAAPSFEAAGEITSASTRFWVRLYDGMAAYFLGDFDRASSVFADVAGLEWALPANIDLVYFAMFSALAAARSFPKKDALEKMENGRAKLFAWSAINPSNFSNKLLLVDAEMARLRGDDLLALQLFDESIARAGDFVHERALGHELAAIHCTAMGLETIASQHGRAARAAYQRWGAEAKASSLETAFPRWFTNDFAYQTETLANDDLLGVSLRFAEELELDRLVNIVMRTLLDRSGGRRAMLLAMQDEELVIEAMADETGAVTMMTTLPTAERISPELLGGAVAELRPAIHAVSGVGWAACFPLIKRGILTGMIYLEDDRSAVTPTDRRVDVITRIAAQAAVSLDAARRHTNLIRDSRNQVQAENALRAARVELAKTSHLSVMGGLAASIAHEVNQPLASIVSNAGASIRWLKRTSPNIPEAMVNLTSIQSSGVRAGEIIRGLRALAKQEPTAHAAISLNAVIQDVLRLTEAEIQSQHVFLKVHLHEDNPYVLGDQVQLQQVVFNLVTNAVDAAASAPAGERLVTVSTTLEMTTAIIRIEDNGPGISAELMERIFTPLFTTKPTGMGMGLAICKSIIEAHAGSLEVSPGALQGSVFECRLPRDVSRA